MIPAEHTPDTSRELSDGECWQHLVEHTVGRLAYADRDGPMILPLSYVVQDDAIWFRTASYDQLAIHLPGTRAAFEVDHVDLDHHEGWSVVVRGRAEHVSVDDTTRPEEWPHPVPWPSGIRTMMFRLTPTQVSGRVLSHAGPTSAPGPGAVQRSEPTRTSWGSRAR